MTLYNYNLDLINVNVYTKFGLIFFILCQDIEQNQILTSIKSRNSVANLRKMKLHNPNIDLINVANLRKMKLYTPNIDLINDNVHTDLICVNVSRY